MAKVTSKVVGSLLIAVEEVDSTNRRLKELAADLPEGTVLLAERQTAGRGRFSRRWYSDQKSLTFSVLVRPQLAPEQLTLAALWPAVAVVRSLRQWGIAAASKWPNDVVVGTMKLAGVLIENTIRTGESIESIVGIGLNVNQTENDFPSELIGRGGSMRLVAGKAFDKQQVFASLLECLDETYCRFFQPFSGQELHKAWLELCCHTNQTIQTTIRGRKLAGQFIGLKENGAALLQVGDRILTIENFDSWEIQHAVGD